MKRTIRLTESDLHRIVIESVKQAINEIGDTDEGQYDLGRAAARRYWRSTQENDRDAAISNSDYADRIASHALSQMPSLDVGTNFNYGFEDYIKAMQQRTNNNAQ